VEPEDPRSYYSVSSRLEKETPRSWKANQYDNLSNSAAHYEQTGPEIWEQTEGKITHFICGVGTGGTICGVGKYLKEKNPSIQIIGIDTYGSVFKKYKETGIFDKDEIYPYITEGIGEDFLPQNVDFNVIDYFEKVTDKDAAIMTRRITKDEAIFVGNSSGAVMAGVLQMKDRFKKGDVVVVIFHDHGSRYMGKMFNDEWMSDRGFLQESEITAIQLIERHKQHRLVMVKDSDTIHEVVLLMKKFNISQVPVTDSMHSKIVGSLNDTEVFSKLIDNPNLGKGKVSEIIQPAFPFVDPKASIKEVSRLITSENRAVLVKDIMGEPHIITRQDIIEAFC
jgi:cystathionine beta-synthase